MLDKKFFQSLQEKYKSFITGRRMIIRESNDLLHQSKKIIFSLHRGETKDAEKMLKEVESGFKNASRLFKEDDSLRFEGSYRAALEEYVEAKLFFNFLKNKKITSIKEVEIGFDGYIGGVSDLTGELTRRAVILATKGKIEEVEEIKKIVEDVIAELIEFDLTKYNRVKFDQAKHNLRKLEDILYQTSLRK